MKRDVLIGAISLLSEIGVWALVFAAGILLRDWDYLMVLAAASGVAGTICPLVWMILEENLRGGKRRRERK